jgi:hypothetical protein
MSVVESHGQTRGYVTYTYAGISESTMHIEVLTTKDGKNEPLSRLMLPMKSGEAVLFIKHWKDVPLMKIRLKLNPDATINASLIR